MTESTVNAFYIFIVQLVYKYDVNMSYFDGD